MSTPVLDIAGLLETFFEEAEEHLTTFERGLLELESRPDDRDLLGQVFRAAHSIKGASATFGLSEVTRFTHVLETVLDRLRNGELAYDGDVAGSLLPCVDVLKALVQGARTGAPPPPEALAVESALSRFMPGSPAATPRAAATAVARGPRTVEIRFLPRPEFMSRGMDPLAVVRELLERGDSVERTLDASALPPLESLDPESFHLAWRLSLTTTASDAELLDSVSFVEDLCALEIRELCSDAQPLVAGVEAPKTASAPAAPVTAAHTPAAPPTIRVATEKVDKLLDLVGEIVIAQAMIAEATRSPGEDAKSRLNDALSAMDRHTRELQERVMSIRMVPLEIVFRRIHRIVHDLAGSVGKKVRLDVTGEGTEIDKSMVELLVDPLTHLVRNGIDHGLESPEARVRAGKPEEGVITLRAFHQSGNVVIDVADDGRGLDVSAIRAKAERVGLVAPGAVLTDEEIHDLIFQPGFSTATQVSAVSGRGVGMDVVKRNVEALNGALSISTAAGKGTRMRIRLPLTLAILDGLAVRVGQQTFILPLLSVVEAFRPSPVQVRGILGRPEIIDVRGMSLPIVRLHEVLDTPDAQLDPCRALVCILETNGARIAVQVDEVLGQLQVVVKSLEVNYGKIDALMGATILGDGHVAMIVDVQALARGAGTAPRVERAVRQAARSLEAP